MTSHTLTRFTTLLFTAALLAPAQMHTLTREQMIQYTQQNPFERFPDGRPKAPDALIEKLKAMSAEEVLSIVRKGYANQYADGFKLINPSKNLVGRAMTLQMLPSRPDIADVDQKAWREKHGGRLSHQTAIDMLQKGDVFVVDAFGNLDAGGIVGDNLAYYVWKATGAGFVIDGAIRDLNGIAPTGMGGYYREAVPEAINNVMVAGINVPVRIGKVTVMPGDIVLGDREGVFFIPPHLVQDIVDEAEITHAHDVWTKLKFDEGKYKSSEIYGRPSDPALIKEYEAYLKAHVEPRIWERYQKGRQRGPRPAQGAKP
ncbi:MAG: dimethylmenaquinone methyltransferase [Bryobacterales bacterium]|nr:dimethylmenaquinone methyltransferase [Bryobacterales bacterium]